MIKKIIGFIENFILSGCLFLLIILFVSNLFFNTGTIFGLKIMFVPTSSMEPTIHKNQLIVGLSVDNSEIKEGDIVTYLKNDNNDYYPTLSLSDYLINGKGNSYLIVHRIIKINADGSYIFKGDNNKYCDEGTVKPDQIMYKIIYY